MLRVGTHQAMSDAAPTFAGRANSRDNAEVTPPKLISVVMPFYDNPTMLRRHYEHFAKMARATKDVFEFVVVDDGSPTTSATAVARDVVDFDLRIFRVQVDIPWHQHGARNIGAFHAIGKWLLLTDIDHLIPEETLESVHCDLDERFAYTFARRKWREKEDWKPHVNSFLVTHKNFWRSGGYDEDLCGLHGTDMLFRRALFRVAPNRHLAGTYLVLFEPDVVADANTRTFARNNGVLGTLRKKSLIALKEAGLWPTPSVLQTPYERVV